MFNDKNRLMYKEGMKTDERIISIMPKNSGSGGKNLIPRTSSKRCMTF